MYDIKGHVTGFGNPGYKQNNKPATQTNKSVLKLIDAGAICTGKSHLDEFAYSMMGQNQHFGTPPNPNSPGYVPGGSSSGSAVSVACGDSDFSIGSDTGGSTRTPASNCGIYGIRPSHGRISLEETCLQAPSYDTMGWFARTPDLLSSVGEVLLTKDQQSTQKFTPKKLIFPIDLWEQIVDADVASAVYEGIKAQNHKHIIAKTDRDLSSLLPELDQINFETESMKRDIGEDLKYWPEIFRITQGYQFWEIIGGFISKHQDELNMAQGIRERFEMASQITRSEMVEATRKRNVISQRVYEILQNDAAIIIPTVARIPPQINSPLDYTNEFRRRAHNIMCLSGFSGACQISIPIANLKGASIGVSLIMNKGADEELLKLTEKWMIII